MVSLFDERKQFLDKQSRNIIPLEKRVPKKSASLIDISSKRPKMTGKAALNVERVPTSSNPGSHQKFNSLCKIVNHMQARHLNGDTFPLTMNEILEETSLIDLPNRVKTWLENEALADNVRIQVKMEPSKGGNIKKFCYKPPVNIQGRKSLLRLLKAYHEHGVGGILVDDIKISVANADAILKALENDIICIKRTDKKDVIFYNDNSSKVVNDEDLKKLWRCVSLDGVDSLKIEDYLEKQGIFHLKESVPSVQNETKKKKQATRKGKLSKRHNVHVAEMLEDYNSYE